MRLILFFLGGFLLANLVVAGFTAIRPQAQEQSRELNLAQKRGQEPWAANEPYIETARRNARKTALDALAMPVSALCSEQGRGQLVDALNYYYGQRATQMRGYPATWGAAGGQYIGKAWSTADDSRVERLTRETYGRGYFSIDEFGSPTRETIADLLQDERPGEPVCAG